MVSVRNVKSFAEHEVCFGPLPLTKLLATLAPSPTPVRGIDAWNEAELGRVGLAACGVDGGNLAPPPSACLTYAVEHLPRGRSKTSVGVTT